MHPPVDPRWIRNPSDEKAVAEGCYFDEAAGERVCDFIETFCQQSIGRWQGEKIALLDWQRDFLMRLFGWKLPDGRRRFKVAYLEIPKKNGKSTMISALVLYMLLADGEGSPEIYLNACARDQAGIVFRAARAMVNASPELDSVLEIKESKADMRIVHPAGNGAIITNSNVAASKDGLNSSFTVFDELHRAEGNWALWDVFKYAGISRDQPLTVTITTAGQSEEGPWHAQRAKSDAVNLGSDPDYRHLGVVYRAKETDDLDDPATWRACNPSMGHTMREDEFAAEWEEAKGDPVETAKFKRLRFGIIVAEACKYFDPVLWEACKAEPPVRKGADVYAGVDLSETDDLTALVWVAENELEGLDVWARFWLPEENIVALERKHRVPYRVWAKEGLITLNDGPVIDYRSVRKAIVELSKARHLRKVFFDPSNANPMCQWLAEEDGIEAEMIRQNYDTLSQPTKEVKRLVAARKIRHGGNPILALHVANAVGVQGDSGAVRLSKRKSREKIDGAAALVDAVAAKLAARGKGGKAEIFTI